MKILMNVQLVVDLLDETDSLEELYAAAYGWMQSNMYLITEDWEIDSVEKDGTI